MPSCRQREEKKYCIFTMRPRPSTKNCALGVIKKNYNFIILFFGHHYMYYTLNLSDLCLSEKNKILK